MLRKTTISVPFGFLAITVLSGCGPGVGIDLVPVGLPDSSGPVSFCKPVGAPLVVTVKNQGSAAAPASTTKVEFNPGGSFPIPTPAIPAGGSVDLPRISIPDACPNPDCDFKITVDSNGQVNESNEGNNTVNGICIG
jgi:CARDB